MSILLAVDPSLRSTGVALFREGTLIAVSRIKGMPASEDAVNRCRFMSSLVAQWATRVETLYAVPDVIALEWPQIYRETKSKGDHNDLLGLAGVCAAVATRYPNSTVRSYLPAEWQPAPKVSIERKRRGLGPIDSEAFTSPRGIRVMSRLTDAERALVPMSHDAVDAIGIGLFHLGALAPRRVYPGAVD